ncbi:hypothetical protein ACHAPJ_009397 [Fusarium lateritium]
MSISSTSSSVTYNSESSSEGPSPIKDLLAPVSEALDKRAGKDIFAIGGNVEDSNTPSDSAVKKSQLTIRWDNKATGRSSTLRLPIGNDAVAQDSFTSLLMDCQPATFGFGKEEVLDEDYRKAGKMDTDDFCTNFNPYEHGIIDTINQVLAQSSRSDAQGLGVKAELYKLNVYSAPSGKFKPHVDTPRSDHQMGSLVVCLPVKHEGGQLAVRHCGREIVFDWASQSHHTVQWAAFFSDCEHEVLEVTEGHRVTLTYNLFWTSYGPASMSDHLGALDQEALHFYNALEELLQNEEFLKEGGLVGFTCTHAYPHTAKSSLNNLQHMLKGLDMVVYQALKRILGTARVTTVLDDKEYQELYWEHRSRVKRAEKFRGTKFPYRGYSDSSDDESIAKKKKEAKHLSCVADKLKPAMLFRGHNFYDVSLDPGVVRSPDPKSEYWAGDGEPFYHRQKITWLNYPPGSQVSKELSVAFVTYGNEPDIDAYYTSAAIVAKVNEFLPMETTNSGSVTDEEVAEVEEDP